jgi:S1-C subfamily serine protease
LHKGDVVTTLNAKPIETNNDLLTALYLTPAFTHAQVTFVRNATVHHTDLTLGCAL